MMPPPETLKWRKFVPPGLPYCQDTLTWLDSCDTHSYTNSKLWIYETRDRISYL